MKGFQLADLIFTPLPRLIFIVKSNFNISFMAFIFIMIWYSFCYFNPIIWIFRIQIYESLVLSGLPFKNTLCFIRANFIIMLTVFIIVYNFIRDVVIYIYRCYLNRRLISKLINLTKPTCTIYCNKLPVLYKSHQSSVHRFYPLKTFPYCAVLPSR